MYEKYEFPPASMDAKTKVLGIRYIGVAQSVQSCFKIHGNLSTVLYYCDKTSLHGQHEPVVFRFLVDFMNGFINVC